MTAVLAGRSEHGLHIGLGDDTLQSADTLGGQLLRQLCHVLGEIDHRKPPSGWDFH
jgi:hypothetical protein